MLKRNIEDELENYLRLMPAVLITGARQVGKTTFIQEIARKHDIVTIVTFDDEFTLSNAIRDPSGWLQSLPKPIIIDEVQRVPEIFLPIKRDIDQNRTPGKYILTGSANPLLLPQLSDSLSGRMGIISMYPFSQGELRSVKENFITYVFEEDFSFQKIDSFSSEKVIQTVLRGGFPPVQFLTDFQDINRWVRAYLQTTMERDVRNLANVEGLREFPRLFQLLATRCSQLLNISDISRSLGMNHMTVNRYIRLLETLFFIQLLPAWFSNLGKRIIKTPKIQFCDTAFINILLGVDQKRFENEPSLFGQVLESFVYSELVKQKSWAPFPLELYHFRDGDNEVDFILEKADGSLVGIEVKSTRKVNSEDIRGLQYLKKLAKKKFRRGIVLHLGERIEHLAEDLWAMPIQSLWHRF